MVQCKHKRGWYTDSFGYMECVDCGKVSKTSKTAYLDLLARAAVLILILAAIVGFSILCLAI